MNRFLGCAPLLVAAACQGVAADTATPPAPTPPPAAHANTADLGNFSVSLAVKDITASRAFYEALGFRPVGGNPARNWVVLRNGDCKIGLFQGMFPTNILTFNPGWSHDAKPLPAFDDIRVLQKRFEDAGLKLTTRADEASKGPASFTLADPDGNVILFDQHVP